MAVYPDVRQMNRLPPEQMCVHALEDGSIAVGAWENGGAVWYERFDAETGRHMPGQHHPGSVV